MLGLEDLKIGAVVLGATWAVCLGAICLGNPSKNPILEKPQPQKPTEVNKNCNSLRSSHPLNAYRQ